MSKNKKPMTDEQKVAKRVYDVQYSKNHIKKRVIDFNMGSGEDMKILEHLDAQPNKSRYVKDLILEDMNVGT